MIMNGGVHLKSAAGLSNDWGPLPSVCLGDTCVQTKVAGRPVEKDWKSIELVEECLVDRGVKEKEAKAATKWLREAH